MVFAMMKQTMLSVILTVAIAVALVFLHSSVQNVYVLETPQETWKVVLLYIISSSKIKMFCLEMVTVILKQITLSATLMALIVVGVLHCLMVSGFVQNVMVKFE